MSLWENVLKIEDFEGLEYATQNVSDYWPTCRYSDRYACSKKQHAVNSGPRGGNFSIIQHNIFYIPTTRWHSLELLYFLLATCEATIGQEVANNGHIAAVEQKRPAIIQTSRTQVPETNFCYR